jgi:hypothetical protein
VVHAVLILGITWSKQAEMETELIYFTVIYSYHYSVDTTPVIVKKSNVLTPEHTTRVGRNDSK